MVCVPRRKFSKTQKGVRNVGLVVKTQAKLTVTEKAGESSGE